MRITEHREEILYIVHIPATDVPTEPAVAEHFRHVFYVADIPLADVAVECLELAEKFPHVPDGGRIDAVQVRTGALALDLLADGSDERRFCLRHMLEAGYDADARILHCILQKAWVGDIDILEVLTKIKNS